MTSDSFHSDLFDFIKHECVPTLDSQLGATAKPTWDYPNGYDDRGVQAARPRSSSAFNIGHDHNSSHGASAGSDDGDIWDVTVPELSSESASPDECLTVSPPLDHQLAGALSQHQSAGRRAPMSAPPALLGTPMMGPDNSDPASWSPLFGTTEQGESSSAAASVVASGLDNTVPPAAEWAALDPPKIEQRFQVERRSAVILGGSSARVSKTSPRDRATDGLPPVVVEDPSDAAAVRRARNTEAARRSRARKNERIKELEELVSQLRSRNAALETENSILRKLHKLETPARPST